MPTEEATSVVYATVQAEGDTAATVTDGECRRLPTSVLLGSDQLPYGVDESLDTAGPTEHPVSWALGTFDEPTPLWDTESHFRFPKLPADDTTSAFFTRLLPRILGDVVAVAVGSTIFDVMTGTFNSDQALFGLVYVLVAALIDLTHIRREWSRVEEVILAVKVAIGALIMTTAVVFLVAMRASRVDFLTVTMTMIVGRPILAESLRRLEGKNRSVKTVVALCDDEEFSALTEAIADREIAPLRLVARVGTEEPDHLTALRSRGAGELLAACERYRPWRIVIGMHSLDQEELTEALIAANEAGVGIRSIGRFFEEEFGRVTSIGLDRTWFLFDISPLHHLGYRICRRLIDLVAGVIIGVLCALLFPFIGLAIKVESRGPVLYRQRRIGQHGSEFQLCKFRTMTSDAEKSGACFAALRDQRVTRTGNFLRRSRLDELPQFVNLVRGEMSLIGPRPERPEFIDRLESEISFFEKRQLIKPGLTGWAQVHEGYGSTTDEMRRKLERDLYYLKYQSLGLDLRILAGTVSNVLRLQGR